MFANMLWRSTRHNPLSLTHRHSPARRHRRDNMMWGSDYPHSESTFPQSRRILAEILAGMPDDERAKIAGRNTARVYNFDVARLTVPA